jgi:hypothetical protein
MQFHLLDAGLSLTFTDSIILLFVATAIVAVVEALIMLPFKINKPGNIFLYSLLVNIASVAVGFAALSWFQEGITSRIVTWLLLFIVTVLVEGFLLFLLNKQKESKKVWMATIAMNIVTYVLLYVLFGG